MRIRRVTPHLQLCAYIGTFCVVAARARVHSDGRSYRLRHVSNMGEEASIELSMLSREDNVMAGNGSAIANDSAGAYEAARQRHLRALQAGLSAEIEKMDWSLEQLQALRDERLRAMVRHAKEHSPWHARRLRDVDPDRLHGNDLSMIPTMNKADLMENWDEIVTDRRLTLALANAHLSHLAKEGPAYLLDDYHVVASGGSTGLRGVFVWDFEGWLAAQAAVSRHLAWLTLHGFPEAGTRVASVGAASPIHITRAMGATFAGPAESSRSFPITRPLAETVAGLNAFQPTALSSVPTMLHRLALEAQTGRLRIAPHLLICATEPLRPDARRTIESVFGAPLIDGYGCSEGYLTAVSYPGESDLHLVEDTAVYEPVDRAGQAVRPGERASALLITNVINKIMPLIRYEISDEVLFLDGPNAHSWAGRRIAPVQGRRDDIFVYQGDIAIHPHIFRSTLAKVPNIYEYQVRQTPRGGAVTVCGADPGTLDRLRDDLVSALGEAGLPDPEISVCSADAIARHAETGKIKRFVPLAPDGPAPTADSRTAVEREYAYAREGRNG
jgi:phenylacetate-CoA ligase